MSHPTIDNFFERLADVWPHGAARDDALAELRDHVESVYETELECGSSEQAALERALAECGEVRQLAAKFQSPSFPRRARWMMRLSTAALVGGILAAGSIAIWWPGETAPRLAVAPAQAQQTPRPKAAAPPVVDEVEANNALAQKKLSKYIPAEFEEASLSDLLVYISGQTEVETYINRKALEAAGVASDATISIFLKKVRADMLLDLALQQVGEGDIDYVIRDGILVITSVESLDGASEVKAYPVADLLRLHAERRRGGPEDAGAEGTATEGAGPTSPSLSPGSSGGFGGGGLGGFHPDMARGFSTHMPSNVEQLVSVVTNTVAPDSWHVNGGFGTITYYGDMLVIRQNARTHREVEKVLKLLRDTAANK